VRVIEFDQNREPGASESRLPRCFEPPLLQVVTTRSCQTMAEEQIQALRLELKTWEKQFSVQHGGKRPSREDIKNNAEIGMQARDLESPVRH
jgi:hypothetical protein